ncbi:unnamed protein product [Acanthoscelides obtectus]|uniref:Uncharacterized protein n=1 Tax=Acanthoscelides obtectus TaxID=200917 RepID=A0A9P0K805_ACAOB|nr:unnamed protein product [Acanthoscelides obtectus]CAK1648007.1 hypothetical protein AOBTE_LOCUS15498 [Acanthoscelides obtectus]
MSVKVQFIRDIPSDSEDSELSDDEDQVGTPISTNNLGRQDLQDTDSDPNDIPLAQLFHLPPSFSSPRLMII